MRHELGRERQARVPYGHGHHWREAGSRRKGVLTGLDESEEINACTVKCKVDVDGEEQDWLLPVQERDAQPSHGDRAVRRRGHLPGRRHPRPLVRAAATCTRPCASPARPTRWRPCPRRCPASCRSASWSPRPLRAIAQLRQPDRPGNRPGERAVPPRLRGQAHGDRRRGGRNAGRPRASRDARAGRRGGAAGRPHRPRRHRRRHGLLQGAQPGVAGAPAAPRCRRATPPEERKIQRLFRNGEATPPDQALQRLRRGRRVRGHRRAGRRPVHRPGHACRRSTRAWTAPSWPSPRAQERMAVALARRGRGRVHRATRTRRTSRPPSVAEVTEEARAARCAWNGDAIVDVSPRVPAIPTARRSTQDVHVVPAAPTSARGRATRLPSA